MRTDEALARAQLEDTERANVRMLDEIKTLNNDMAAMRHIIRRRYYEIKTGYDHEYKDIRLQDLSNILGAFEDKKKMDAARREINPTFIVAALKDKANG